MHTKPLLPDYPARGGRQPPPELVRLLREVDPRAELVYCGVGQWLLGIYNPNSIVAGKAERVIAALRDLQSLAGHGSIVVPSHIKTVLSFRLWRWEGVRQGLRAIKRYRVENGEPQSWIHEDFRMRDYNYRDNFEQQIKLIEEAADEEVKLRDQIGRLREYLQLEHRGVHKHAFQKPLISIPSGISTRRKVG